MTIRVDPYKAGSKSAKALSRATGILRATPKQVRRHGTFDTIVNWGNSERRFANATYINNPEAVAVASDKLQTADALSAANVAQPEYTRERSVANTWLGDGVTVVVRRILRGSRGTGISLAFNGGHPVQLADEGVRSTTAPVLTPRGEAQWTSSDHCSRREHTGCRHNSLIRAPLYNKYVKKADEYRIHVFDGQIIDIQQKRARREVPNEEVDYQIRNSHNGWVYCRDSVRCPDICRNLALDAVSALGLTFGAVDLGYNIHGQSCVVYEVNTAPGLEGTTVEKYYEAILHYLPAVRGGVYARRRVA